MCLLVLFYIWAVTGKAESGKKAVLILPQLIFLCWAISGDLHFGGFGFNMNIQKNRWTNTSFTVYQWEKIVFINQVGEGEAYVQKSGMISVAASWPSCAITLIRFSTQYLAELSFVKTGEDKGVYGSPGMAIWTKNIKLSFKPDAYLAFYINWIETYWNSLFRSFILSASIIKYMGISDRGEEKNCIKSLFHVMLLLMEALF